MRETFEDTDFSDVDWLHGEPAERHGKAAPGWAGSVLLCFSLALAFWLVLVME